MIAQTEEELIHAIQRWYKRHGKSLIIAILILASIVAGWMGAKRHNSNKLLQASIIYEELLDSLNTQQATQTEKLANQLITNYSHTPYAKLSALILVKNLISQEKRDAAKTQLMWVMEKSEVPAIRQIARNRLARILLSENHPKEALDTLSTLDDATFTPLIDGIKGDIQKASGKNEAAIAAYQNALNNWPTDFPGKELIKLKLRQISS